MDFRLFRVPFFRRKFSHPHRQQSRTPFAHCRDQPGEDGASLGRTVGQQRIDDGRVSPDKQSPDQERIVSRILFQPGRKKPDRGDIREILRAGIYFRTIFRTVFFDFGLKQGVCVFRSHFEQNTEDRVFFFPIFRFVEEFVQKRHRFRVFQFDERLCRFISNFIVSVSEKYIRQFPGFLFPQQFLDIRLEKKCHQCTSGGRSGRGSPAFLHRFTGISSTSSARKRAFLALACAVRQSRTGVFKSSFSGAQARQTPPHR